MRRWIVHYILGPTFMGQTQLLASLVTFWAYTFEKARSNNWMDVMCIYWIQLLRILKYICQPLKWFH